MSALLVTMGGYAGSEGNPACPPASHPAAAELIDSGETTELTSYSDAYAAIDFLEYLYAVTLHPCQHLVAVCPTAIILFHCI